MTYLRNSALLFIIVGFTIFIIWWSNQVELDEFARMQGSVIPSTKEKVIQSEFPGRLISTNVVVGQFVLEGDILAKVQDEELNTDLMIKTEEAKRAEAALIRTAALQNEKIPEFDETWTGQLSQIASEQVVIARTRLITLNSEKKLLASELRQLKQQISDSKSELLAVERSLDLVREEEKIMVPMVERGYEPELKLIQLKQKIEDSINRRQRIENELDLLALQVREIQDRNASIMASFFEQLANEYDEVVYLDFDVVPNTDYSIFRHLDLSKINALPVNANKKNIWSIGDLNTYNRQKSEFDVIVSQFDKQSMYCKMMAKRAMLMTQNIAGTENIINTGILAGDSKSISSLKLFKDFLFKVDTLKQAQKEKMFGEELSKKFFLNNEVFFTFHLEYNNIDYNKLEPLWHFMLLSGHLAPNNEDTSQAYLIHVIDKNFERVFKLCGIQ